VKLGTRITFTTVTLVMISLSLYGWVSIRNRRAELAFQSSRELEHVGTAARVTLEAALKDGLFQDLSQLVARWQAAEPDIGFVYSDLTRWQPGQQPHGFVVGDSEGVSEPSYLPLPTDPTRSGRLLRVYAEVAPYGEHVVVGGRAVYVLMEPIRDPDGKGLAGAIELVRDETALNLQLVRSEREAAGALVGMAGALILLVWLTVRGGISNPVKRLVEAIDDVTHGDLGRVILRERDDEVGDLAERFNEMTASLREAREQILQGVDAKLALEARLRHSEKLATIGQLAAGIAHEVGTPLNVIGGRARAMEKKAQDPAEVAKNAGIIAAQTQRITKIIQQLLDFARRPQTVRTAVNLERVAADCLEFLEHQLTTSRVEVQVEPFVSDGDDAPGQPLVLGDADQLQQVCLNLCLNAVQAMEGGGRLILSTRGLSRRRPGLDAAAPGRYAVLEVTDTGIGIPEADRERIFEPFYSTKSPSADRGKEQGGTGLGLAVSGGIVKDHDGWVEIDNRPGGGTIFRVFLPAADSI
jgi:signal transduction histidine kinase